MQPRKNGLSDDNIEDSKNNLKQWVYDTCLELLRRWDHRRRISGLNSMSVVYYMSQFFLYWQTHAVKLLEKWTLCHFFLIIFLTCLYFFVYYFLVSPAHPAYRAVCVVIRNMGYLHGWYYDECAIKSTTKLVVNCSALNQSVMKKYWQKLSRKLTMYWNNINLCNKRSLNPWS